jgi:predicted amidohydrolase YtcJ
VIGDGAVAELVEGLRQAAELVGSQALRRAAHRLEHVEGVQPGEARTLAELGVIASVQPAFDAFWGGEKQMYAIRLGAERALAMNPFGDLHRAGVTLAFGSDSPVTPFAPWEAVRAALTHHNEGQRLNIGVAIEAHTSGGRRAAKNPEQRLQEGDPAVFTAWTSPGIRVAAAMEAPMPLAALTEELAGGDEVPELVLAQPGRAPRYR